MLKYCHLAILCRLFDHGHISETAEAICSKKILCVCNFTYFYPNKLLFVFYHYKALLLFEASFLPKK